MCALHHKVVEEHQRELTPGAVMVLRQVGTRGGGGMNVGHTTNHTKHT